MLEYLHSLLAGALRFALVLSSLAEAQAQAARMQRARVAASEHGRLWGAAEAARTRAEVSSKKKTVEDFFK